MPIAKVRNLSKYGAVPDVDPYNLPPEAWSLGVNVRFKQGSVERAPVFRRVPVTLAQSDPRFCTTETPSTGFDSVLVAYKNGQVAEIVNNTETDVSILGYVDADAELPWSACRLGDVQYINRGDRVPWSKTNTDVIFQNLANWDANWRCKILRALNDSLLAFGITKSGTVYPTMVKSSDFAQVNTVPATWDETDTTANAYENIFAEMQSPIMEACALNGNMYVFGLRETWEMRPTATNAIWDVSKKYDAAGCVGVNCAVEADGLQYVFGLDDIWVHDGSSKQSICNDSVRWFIFNSLNASRSDEFFVQYDALRKEVRFCYVSGDRATGFDSAPGGCNRCAVFYIPEKTWQFDDLPYARSATTANIDTVQTWSTVTGTWESTGGSWQDQDDSQKKTLIMVTTASSPLTDGLYAVDAQGEGSAILYPVDTNATLGVTLEKDGLDLDEIATKLEGYKVVSSIFPQARLETDAEPLMFSFGAADNYNQSPTFTDPQSYDGDEFFRCDFNEGGRWFFMRITHDDYHYFKLTGYDLDMYEIGDR